MREFLFWGDTTVNSRNNPSTAPLSLLLGSGQLPVLRLVPLLNCRPVLTNNFLSSQLSAIFLALTCTSTLLINKSPLLCTLMKLRCLRLLTTCLIQFSFAIYHLFSTKGCCCAYVRDDVVSSRLYDFESSEFSTLCLLITLHSNPVLNSSALQICSPTQMTI